VDYRPRAVRLHHSKHWPWSTDNGAQRANGAFIFLKILVHEDE